eukprot:5625730-Ditylum_brightwellii.AAC.1
MHGKMCNNTEYCLGVEFEYTSYDKSQQNHLAELKLALAGNEGRVLIIDANVPMEVRYIMC